jgi:hypothetical protein
MQVGGQGGCGTSSTTDWVQSKQAHKFSMEVPPHPAAANTTYLLQSISSTLIRYQKRGTFSPSTLLINILMPREYYVLVCAQAQRLMQRPTNAPPYTPAAVRGVCLLVVRARHGVAVAVQRATVVHKHALGERRRGKGRRRDGALAVRLPVHHVHTCHVRRSDCCWCLGGIICQVPGKSLLVKVAAVIVRAVLQHLAGAADR